MCGRITQYYSWSELRDAYDLLQGAPAQNVEPRYNIGRYQRAHVVIRLGSRYSCENALFEFVPPYWKKPLKEKKFTTFNAKGEGLISGETKTFASAWKDGRRGVLPVSGFFEWPRPKKRGQAPYYIQPAKGDFLWLGIVWSSWKNPETDETSVTFAIVTTAPNSVMESIPHHRCPLIIDQSMRRTWVEGAATEAAAIIKPANDD